MDDESVVFVVMTNKDGKCLIKFIDFVVIFTSTLK